MKVITLAEDTTINGQLCRKGQLVQVEDGFDTNVKKVVATPQDIKTREVEFTNKVKDIDDKIKREKDQKSQPVAEVPPKDPIKEKEKKDGKAK